MSEGQRSCLIFGSGRSGTSLVAGLLARAGYFMGDRLLPAGNPANLKGFFEDEEVNWLNEKLLARTIRRYQLNPWRQVFQHEYLQELGALGDSQRWLAALPAGTRMGASRQIKRRIRALTSRQPFCFKDPRFSYTWQVWRPLAPNPLLVCVFRDPAVTIDSMISHAGRAPYLRNLSIDFARAQRVWESTYSSVLEYQHPAGGDWVFVHYDQVMDGRAFAALESRLGIRVDRDFPAAELRNSRSAGTVSARAAQLYERLCELAGFAPAG